MWRVREFIYRLRQAWSIIKGGRSGCEVWSFYSAYAEFALPRLKAFRDDLHGHPVNLTFEEWQQILDRIIGALELIVQDDIYDQETEEEINDACELFGKYYRHLWD